MTRRTKRIEDLRIAISRQSSTPIAFQLTTWIVFSPSGWRSTLPTTESGLLGTTTTSISIYGLHLLRILKTCPIHCTNAKANCHCSSVAQPSL
ncbi:hypothetical protein CAEBREN_16796 [Caenorhabditis brenneri]|uniref:Uncharacterized protein n=1 Tax=Caenorhabditis brenneri TaxID=135651 RepID=G0NDY4_CAEBE|nr:hypothetical protein CAEBREN_16796 [Caenorhabditis brenneri]